MVNTPRSHWLTGGALALGVVLIALVIAINTAAQLMKSYSMRRHG